VRERGYYQPSGISANGRAYAEVFLRRVHELVWHGYAKLEARKLRNSQEEDITGELVRAIERFLDDTTAPHWTRLFSVHEEPRIHDPKRKGKRRLRLDIRIDSAQELPRSRMRFEAKRLGPRHGVSVYLGPDGIHCFLDGRYAREDWCGGMLGYVQEGKTDEWASAIERAMQADSAKLRIRRSGGWRSVRVAAELRSTYLSAHDRPSVGHPIEIFHTLLLFN